MVCKKASLGNPRYIAEISLNRECDTNISDIVGSNFNFNHMLVFEWKLKNKNNDMTLWTQNGTDLTSIIINVNTLNTNNIYTLNLKIQCLNNHMYSQYFMFCKNNSNLSIIDIENIEIIATPIICKISGIYNFDSYKYHITESQINNYGFFNFYLKFDGSLFSYDPDLQLQNNNNGNNNYNLKYNWNFSLKDTNINTNDVLYLCFKKNVFFVFCRGFAMLFAAKRVLFFPELCLYTFDNFVSKFLYV